MTKTKPMTNVVAKYDSDKGRLVLTIPVQKAIEEGGLELSSREKSYLVASTHGNQIIEAVPGVSFALNVVIKRDTYERIQKAKSVLAQQSQPAQPAGLTAEELATLKKLLAKLA